MNRTAVRVRMSRDIQEQARMAVLEAMQEVLRVIVDEVVAAKTVVQANRPKQRLQEPRVKLQRGLETSDA